MYWENVEGMFTFHTLYSNMVQKFPSNSLFVEIGTWKGKSTIFMAEKIKESSKEIKFYAIDSFDGFGGGYADAENKDLLTIYNKNIEPVKSYIQTLIGFSFDLFKNFEDDSIDFLFIDGDHRYEGVKRDLQLWFPKIKNGGIISGHDYDEPSCGVRKAVDEYFAFGAQSYIGGCWYFEK